MTEFVDANTQAALMTQLTTPTLGYPIAYPLITYAPIIGQAYLQAWPLNKGSWKLWGLNYRNSSIIRGFFQVDVVTPDGAGEAPGLRIRELICNRFVLGTVLAAGSRKLEVTAEPQTAPTVKDAPWVRFPVSIPYQIILN